MGVTSWAGTAYLSRAPEFAPFYTPVSRRAVLCDWVWQAVVRPYTIAKKYSPLKPLGHLRPNFGGMVRGWSPSKFVSGSPDLQPTWSLLLKIKKGMKFFKSSSLKLLGQLELDFASIVLWWPPFKIVCGNPDIQPTWPLLLKTEKLDEILIFVLLNY